MKYRFLPLVAVLAVGAVLFSLNIWGYDLWPADEPRFGEVAREMLHSGDWIVLHVNGVIYKEKPPLLFWFIAAISAPFDDVNETTARIPSVFGALLAVMFTYLLALRLYGTRVALFASVVLIASTRFWWQARTAQIDMLLTGCLSAALYAFWRFHESHDKKWLLMFFGAIAAAVYAKGPPGAVFPILLTFTFYWKRREERRQVHLWLGLLAVAALIALWFIPARLMAAPEVKTAFHEGIAANLFRQTIGRFVLGVSKSEPPWFYLENLPIDLLPWTLFLPWTIYAVWKRRREGDTMRLLLCWSVPALIFFSISAGKRAIYILPLYPAFAILIATTVIELMERENLTWVRRAVASAWTAFLFAVVIAAVVVPMYAESHPEQNIESANLIDVVHSPEWMRVNLVAAVCAVFALHGLFTVFRKQGRTAPYVMAGHFAGLTAMAAVLLLPFVNTFKGASDFCAPLRTLSERGEQYALYSVRFSSEAFIFYSKHFHTPFLVDDWPLTPPPGQNAQLFLAQQKAIGEVLMRATRNLPVADVSHVSDAELAHLKSTIDQAFAFAATKTSYAPQFREGITKAVDDFSSKFEGKEPALLFVQEEDWKWLLPFNPKMRSYTVLSHEGVGSRRILLLGNQAGADLYRSVAPIAAKITALESIVDFYDPA